MIICIDHYQFVLLLFVDERRPSNDKDQV